MSLRRHGSSRDCGHPVQSSGYHHKLTELPLTIRPLILPSIGSCWTDHVPLPGPGAEFKALGAAQFPGPCEPSLRLMEASMRTIILVPGSFVAPEVTYAVPEDSGRFSGIERNVLELQRTPLNILSPGPKSRPSARF
ncbi:hypothetical protein PENPOL_c003G05318 [Penicillium polonicum]|uniref:Uncharacterized protein n=1 Tax=Penicillium polonicum TaxID=60169 RepID=A0A1V6NT79_PENPO|nr:hypothetical protein PENPOL_c003G05318 [Penicillium polonicum]